MQIAEGVDEARVQKLGELAALLVGEAGVAAVGARVLKVDLVVGNVEIAAHHHGLGRAFRAVGQDARFKVLAHVPEGIVPAHAVIDTLKLILGVGRVNAHEPILLKLADDHAAFGVKLGNAHFVDYLQGRHLGKNGRPRVTLLLGVTPVFHVAGQVHFDLPFLKLGFLQGENVGVELGEDIHEALFHDGAQAVDVPRNKPHAGPLTRHVRPQAIPIRGAQGTPLRCSFAILPRQEPPCRKLGQGRTDSANPMRESGRRPGNQEGQA